ncbi:hypothetical protein PR002_g20692, partial [Phytophthora rubi]
MTHQSVPKPDSTEQAQADPPAHSLKYRTESWWCRLFDQVMARLEELAADAAGPVEESS